VYSAKRFIGRRFEEVENETGRVPDKISKGKNGTTTIAERGTTEITTMGNTCASCHTMADPQWDFVCNTYGEAGAGDCGFDLMSGQLDAPIANDPRCD
jgi:hypothetical protein